MGDYSTSSPSSTCYTSECESEYEDCKGMSKKKQLFMIGLLMVNSLCLWITFGIRSGFLLGSFAEHDIPSGMAGLVEGSMLLGYILTFVSGLGNFLMRRYNSRILLAGNSGITALLTLATGVVYLDHRNLTVVIVSIGLRILQGCCSYFSYVFLFDTFSAQFSAFFDLAVALNGLAGYAGMGLSVTIGCVLFDKLGYVTTFAVASAFCMVQALFMLFLPPTPTYLSTQKPENRGENKEEDSVKKVNKLSWLTIIPLIASLFINLNFGYLQVTMTEFMHESLGKSYSFGGLVFSLSTVGLILGSIFSGIVLQEKLIKANTQMLFGAILMVMALLLAFPPASVEWIAAFSSWPASLLAGAGESLVTLAAITAMYDVQREVRGEVTPKCATNIAGMWVVGYAGFYFGGSGMAGAVKGLLSFYHMSLVMVGCCALSGVMCVLIGCINRKKSSGEKTPLLST